MKNTLLILTALLAVPAALCAADMLTIPADSPAVVFSPGNWTGDDGRGGKLFRQTWNSGAYFRVAWVSRQPPAGRQDPPGYVDLSAQVPAAADRLLHRRRLEVQNLLHRRDCRRGDRRRGKT